ncbi:antifungal protein ginkbilobin-like protein [Syzygium oleosum]|uniref:antifungal protein ginkbilobin-like protein n=1 Tax=Syzygium oleosum TaxID=219896 RepID=UPI0011D2BF91|nr:antifungal protein ginkbilobin-like protein [Syzygium oleosum]
MDTPSRVAIMLVGSLLMFHVVQGAPDTSIVYGGCNIGTYSSGDPYASSVAYVLADMETVTPNHANYDYFTTSPYPTVVAYGHATCNSALSYSDCGICVSAAKARILADCPKSVGVHMVFEDCSMRYESYSFTD